MTQHKKYDSYGFRIKPKINQNNNTKNKIENSNYSFLGLIITFIVLIGVFTLMLISGYISWNCYANDLPSVRLLKTILASVFFYLYLPYFLFMRIILKTPCLS